MPGLGCLVQGMTLLQDSDVLPAMALSWCHEFQGTVTVDLVVPVLEPIGRIALLDWAANQQQAMVHVSRVTRGLPVHRLIDVEQNLVLPGEPRILRDFRTQAPHAP